MMRAARLLVATLFMAAILARFCHLDILWVEEAYPSAAAAEINYGKTLYRNIWFDKPPLYAHVYRLWGAVPGWPLRLGGAAFLLITCAVLYRTGGLLSAALAAFYLTFGIPSAVMALAPDLLTFPLHVLAVYWAGQGRALHAGAAAGVGLLFNTKAAFVALACVIWLYRSPSLLLVGFMTPIAMWIVSAVVSGALASHLEQVWRWGLVYSRDTFVEEPLREAVIRTFNWAGFHLTAVTGVIVYLLNAGRSERIRNLCWIALCFAAVCAGWRFFPRYYFHLLAPAIVLGTRGLLLMSQRWRMATMALLLIPLIRFGPRYVELATDLIKGRPHQWSDLALYQDSVRVSNVLRASSRPDDTLLVWGYRPDIFVLSHLHAGTPFLDSQPLTGVFADRHLQDSTPTAKELSGINRHVLRRYRPSFIVDGLGPLNPALGIEKFSDLTEWLCRYKIVGRTGASVIYQLAPVPNRLPSGEER
jgi:hypothetical protein